ncbi:barstar family protein [Rhodococcus sp. NPDC003318]|uniref:barstar family protein n=1 Tax=Rhodococcus sp. NPDC003318 TaxID=3364503 RepID=UPI0036C09C5D
MTTLERFAAGTGSEFAALAGSPRDADNAAFALSELGHTVRLVRGATMRTVAAVYDEFAAALQFPYHFEPGKAAFGECLRDWRDWLGDAPALFLVIRDADILLGDEPGALTWLLSALADAGIRVVGQVDRGRAVTLAHRWTSAGVSPVRLDT